MELGTVEFSCDAGAHTNNMLIGAAVFGYILCTVDGANGCLPQDNVISGINGYRKSKLFFAPIALESNAFPQEYEINVGEI